MTDEFDPPLDPGIARAVECLREIGLTTVESCQGGPGHAFPEPAVRIRGDVAEGFKAYACCLDNGLNVSELRRVWSVVDGELHGPVWDIIFQKGEER